MDTASPTHTNAPPSLVPHSHIPCSDHISASCLQPGATAVFRNAEDSGTPEHRSLTKQNSLTPELKAMIEEKKANALKRREATRAARRAEDAQKSLQNACRKRTPEESALKFEEPTLAETLTRGPAEQAQEPLTKEVKAMIEENKAKALKRREATRAARRADKAQDNPQKGCRQRTPEEWKLIFEDPTVAKTLTRGPPEEATRSTSSGHDIGNSGQTSPSGHMLE